MFFFVSVLIRKINFKMFIKRTSFLKDCALKKSLPDGLFKHAVLLNFLAKL